MHDPDIDDEVEALQASIGRRVAAARQALGWTQATLANHLQIEPSQVSRLEAGKRAFTIRMLYQMSRVLGVPVDQLIGGPSSVSAQEMALLSLVRTLSAKQRAALGQFIEAVVIPVD